MTSPKPDAGTTARKTAPRPSASKASSGEDERGCLEWFKAKLLPGLVLEQPSVLCFLKNIQNFACGLWILSAVGFAFFLISLMPPHNTLLAWQSLLLWASSGSAILVIGTDPCFLQRLRHSVDRLTLENTRLETSSAKLQTQLQDLSQIDQQFQMVHQQLESDAVAALSLLRDLEHNSRMEAVTSSMNLFLNADMDRSGCLSPEEAETFLPFFSQLWDLIPDYPQDARQHVEGDFTFQLFSKLLRVVVNEDPRECRAILDAICVKPPSDLVLKSGTRLHVTDKRGTATDLESGGDDSPGSSQGFEDGGMRPCMRIGPLEIWGTLHLVAILLMLVAVGCVVSDLVTLHFLSCFVAFAMLVLGGGLASNARLLVSAERLREEIRRYNQENDKLSEEVGELAGRVTHLRSIQKGLASLHNKFGGNAKRAQQLATRGASHAKAKLVSVTLELFARADEDGNGILEGEELDEFLSTFEEVCKHIPGIDLQRIRESETEGLTLRQVLELVDDVLKRSAGFKLRV